MEIAILDGYTLNPGDLDWNPLKELGTCRIYDRTSKTDEDEIVSHIGSAEIVITNKTPLSEQIFDRCPSIRYIGVLATGYDIVDVKAAAERGIPVCNIPSYGTEAVAQYAAALLLEVSCRVGHHDRAVHEGRWEKGEWCFWDYPLIELLGKTIGIIGYGRIGKAFGRIASAMGMHVLAYNRHGKPGTTDGGIAFASLDEIFRKSDVISLHCPLFPETREMINEDTISRMKDGVIIINNSRGLLIDEKALKRALDAGKVRAAAVDVVSSEPIKHDNPLLSAKNCIITPHISWAAKETRERLMGIAVDNVKAFLAGKPVNVVNM